MDDIFRGSPGGIGLGKARKRLNKLRTKRLAKSPHAFTVKIPTPFDYKDDYGFGNWGGGVLDTPDKAAHFLNQRAQSGRFVRYEQDGKTGNIVRAFLTDIGECWARVIPDQETKV